MIQITFLLLCFFSQDVTVISVMTLNLSRSGESKSFLCAGICFLLWHFFNFLNCYTILTTLTERLWQRIYLALRTLFF